MKGKIDRERERGNGTVKIRITQYYQKTEYMIASTFICKYHIYEFVTTQKKYIDIPKRKRVFKNANFFIFASL